MKLYEIADDIRALFQLAEKAVDEETGEPVPLTDEDRATVEQWFAESKDSFDAKLENYGRFMKNLGAGAAAVYAERDAMKAEMDRLNRRAKAEESKRDRLRALLLFTFSKLGIKKHKTLSFSFNVQNTAKSAKPGTMFNADALPDWVLKKELSGTKVKEALQSGKLYEKDGPLDRGKLFYKADGGEKELLGVAWLGGETLVVR
jgi:hypothetical protein